MPPHRRSIITSIGAVFPTRRSAFAEYVGDPSKCSIRGEVSTMNVLRAAAAVLYLSLAASLACAEAPAASSSLPETAEVSGEVDAYIRLRMEREHIPGLSLAVVKAGKVIKADGYGIANLELGVPATPS